MKIPVATSINYPIPARGPQAQDTLGEELSEALEESPIFLRAGLYGTAAFTAATAYPSTWLHEVGHAEMAKLMFTDANPSIEVFPFNGGVMRYTPNTLSKIGEKFGRQGALAMVSGAGALVDMGVAATTFGIGFKMRKEHPHIGAALMGYGAMTVVNDIAYAASAVGGDLVKLSREGHDFASLGVRAGLPPIASIAIMAAILPLEYMALKWLEDRQAV